VAAVDSTLDRYDPDMRDLTTWESLQPLVGTTSESANLDFKETLDPSREKIEIECAKDVAALANVLGGHVLIGVSTEMNRTRCTGFHGVAKQRATEITKAFEESVKNRCRPTPVFNVQSIDLLNTPNVVVVVAVEASPIAPVGVLLRQERGGALVDEGWAFPYRVGSLTKYLQPDQFGAYESMSARRAAALLSSIPSVERLVLTLRWVVGSALPTGSGYGDGQSSHLESLKVRFDRVDLLGNVATFSAIDDQLPVHLPLDQIKTVWRKTKDGAARWEVSILGSLHRDDGEWQHWPTSGLEP
jgi:hypothetical protein